MVHFKATESEAGDMDLSGLPETAVDSEDDDDEEDIERASDPLMSRDIVRDCLEKDPIDRTDDDIGEFSWENELKNNLKYLEVKLCDIIWPKNSGL